MTPRIGGFQRFAVAIGFGCLFLSLLSLLDPQHFQRGAAVAFIGLCWLLGSRLTYRDGNG